MPNPPEHTFSNIFSSRGDKTQAEKAFGRNHMWKILMKFLPVLLEIETILIKLRSKF